MRGDMNLGDTSQEHGDATEKESNEMSSLQLPARDPARKQAGAPAKPRTGKKCVF